MWGCGIVKYTTHIARTCMHSEPQLPESYARLLTCARRMTRSTHLTTGHIYMQASHIGNQHTDHFNKVMQPHCPVATISRSLHLIAEKTF